MREIYNKYLESEDVVLYDTFRQYIEKLPIEDMEEYKKNVDFSGGDYICDGMESAINVEWISVMDVYPDDMSVKLEIDYIEDPEPSHMIKLRDTFKRLEDKGWTIEDKEDLIKELTDAIEEAKTPDYRIMCYEFIRGMSDEEIRDFYNNHLQ